MKRAASRDALASIGLPLGLIFGLSGCLVLIRGKLRGSQGTWYMDRSDRAAAISALHQGLDLGMTHIDTAEMYGTAEELAAEVIAGRRDQVFRVSKVLPKNASGSGTIAAYEKSLACLKTDRLDSYLLHWRGQYPLEDTIAAFEQLQDQGKILSWGVGNFDVPDLNVPTD